MHGAERARQGSSSSLGRILVCEDCSTLRAPDEVGWVRVWLEEKYQPPIRLIYCPRCAEQFDAYPEDVSPIDDR